MKQSEKEYRERLEMLPRKELAKLIIVYENTLEIMKDVWIKGTKGSTYSYHTQRYKGINEK